MRGLYHQGCVFSQVWVTAVVVVVTSRLIAFHYSRHRNLIQFGCDDVVDAWRTAKYDFAQCAQNPAWSLPSNLD